METDAIAAGIHERTALYTARAEIEALLDDADWPARGGRAFDPGCGGGAMVVAALARIDAPSGDVDAIAARVGGMEFHAPAVVEARAAVADHLHGRGWRARDADAAARRLVRHSDFLQARPADVGRVDLLLCNPPYLRRQRVPSAYHAVIDASVPPHARSDLLHAFLSRGVDMLAPGGTMAVVASDRILVNRNAAGVRTQIGATLGVAAARRLDAASAFHRAKTRTRGTPPRVHAVAMTLTPGGRRLDAEPFRIDPTPTVSGVPLRDVAHLRLAPWLGPDGIFTVDDPAMLADGRLVPCVEPRDICPRTGAIGPTRRWAIVTGEEEPPASVVRHLDARLGAMAPRGRRTPRWLPPERFAHHLPLTHDAVLVPRIATRLRAVPLPAGSLPTGHSLVVASSTPDGPSPALLRAILEDPRVQAQADALALRVEDGFRSYTATLLRQLVVPKDLLAA